MANIEAYGTNIVGSGGSGGGLTQEEHEWLEELYNTRDGIPNLYDVNPNKLTTGNAPGYICVGVATAVKKTCLPVLGYKKIAIMPDGSMTLKWYKSDDTEETIGAISGRSWTSYYDIPNDAIGLILETPATSGTWYNTYYSMLVS